MRPSRAQAVVGAVVLQAALIGVAVAPRLSARLLGDTYLVAVEPLDPIDPFRGAYVTLRYPDLLGGGSMSTDGDALFVRLVRSGDLWRGGSLSSRRPDEGPYIACSSDGQCGIESLFLPQDKAAVLEDDLRDGGGVAELRIDRRGHAIVIRVTADVASQR